jgi:hypothetical protein
MLNFVGTGQAPQSHLQNGPEARERSSHAASKAKPPPWPFGYSLKVIDT